MTLAFRHAFDSSWLVVLPFAQPQLGFIEVLLQPFGLRRRNQPSLASLQPQMSTFFRSTTLPWDRGNTFLPDFLSDFVCDDECDLFTFLTLIPAASTAFFASSAA